MAGNLSPKRARCDIGIGSARIERKMNIGIYNGSAAMGGLEDWQREISANLAASSVSGYKKTEASFEGLLNGRINGSSNNPAAGTGVSQPSLLTRTSFLQGELKRTGKPTDFAISGRGFFEIELPNGSILYTRDGQFQLSPESTLVNRQGYPVRGESGSIRLVPGNGAITVDAKGQIFQGTTQITKLSVVDFADRGGLSRVRGGFQIAEDSPLIPEKIDEPEIFQGYTEGSNVSAVQEMVKLISVSRAYEMNQKVISSFDRRLEQAIRHLGNTR